MANLRRLFARKEKESKHEKIHGERLAQIFLDPANYPAQATAYLAEHQSAHELDFAKVYLQGEINQLRSKIDAKRNNLIASALHYASKSLNKDAIHELIEGIYKTSLDVCAELAIVSFLESKHSHHDKDACIKAAQALDEAYLKDKKLHDALEAATNFQPLTPKAKEELENLKEPEPVLSSAPSMK